MNVKEREHLFFQVKYTVREEVLLTAFSLIRIIFYHCINYNTYTN